MSSTAKGAGNTLRTGWTTACHHEVPTDKLVKSHRRLMDLGLTSRSDESTSARRRFKDLTGPIGLDRTIKELRLGRDVCWRDPVFEKKQAVLTLGVLTKSLRNLRKECWLARVEARSKLSPFQY